MDNYVAQGFTYLLGVLQSRLVHLEDTDKIGTEIREDEELSGGIQDGLVRPGLLLRRSSAVITAGEDLGHEGLDCRGVGNVESVNTATSTKFTC